MNKDEILQKVKAGKYSQEQLIGRLNALPASSEKRRPPEYKVGDVLVHPVFKHPYVLLKKRKEDWLCGFLTTEESFPDILEPCESRFFKESYFVKSLFTATNIQGGFMNVYGNPKHLTAVFNKLKAILK